MIPAPARRRYPAPSAAPGATAYQAPAPSARPMVAAVLLPQERPRVEAAGSGCFAIVHRDSIEEAVRTVRERPVDAVLVSVHRCAAEQIGPLVHLVREFPGVPTVALLSTPGPDATDALLRLGATGIRQVVDVSSPMPTATAIRARNVAMHLRTGTAERNSDWSITFFPLSAG